MRISDWSSDVCSSDLAAGVIEVQVRQHHYVDVFMRQADFGQRIQQYVARLDHAITLAQRRLEERTDAGLEQHVAAVQILRQQIGRASSRERVCQYVLISVVAVSIKKIKPTNKN